MNILNPSGFNPHMDPKQYSDDYFKHRKVLSASEFGLLLLQIEETFEFIDTNMFEYVTTNYTTSGSISHLYSQLEYVKRKEFKEKSAMKVLTHSLRKQRVLPSKVHYSKQVKKSNLLHFWLFNELFLNRSFALFNSGNLVRLKGEKYSNRILGDQSSIEEILLANNSGIVVKSTVITKLMKSNFFYQKDVFDKLKKDILQQYIEGYNSKNNLPVNLLKISKHIENTIHKFPKAEFYIGTSKGDISFIEDRVSTSNPKLFFSIEQDLKQGASKNDFSKTEGGGIKIMTRKRRIHEL